MAWFSKDNKSTELKKADLLKLLESCQACELKELELFRQHKNILTAAMIALLGAGGAALASNTDELRFVALIIPFFVVRLRRHTILSLDRYYQRFLETIAYKAKIEFILGLDRNVWPEDGIVTTDNKIPFSDDEYLDVDRHWLSRKKGKRSNQWVYDHMERGHNDVAWQLFCDICRASTILPFLAAAIIGQWYRPYCILNFWELFIKNLGILAWSAAALVAAYSLYGYDSKEIRQRRERENNILAKS